MTFKKVWESQPSTVLVETLSNAKVLRQETILLEKSKVASVVGELEQGEK